MVSDPVVIVSSKRTPQGSLLGSLSSFSGNELGAHAIKAVIDASGLKANDIQEVIMGCVLPAGQGQAPARQAAIKAGIPHTIGATTVNKMCASGMKAVIFAHDLILAGSQDIILAGGMESMSHAPYLLLKARDGYRLGHDKVYDHMFLDGLEDAYDKGKLMGYFAEQTATTHRISRQAQDEFALTSLTRAQHATNSGFFKEEISPIQVKQKHETVIVEIDEGILTAKPEKIPQLKAAFVENGTVTAANSSSISDGASALILMRKSMAEKLNVTPEATLVAHAGVAQAPHLFTTAPIGAIKHLLHKMNWTVDDVDLFEINEAFAVVAMVAMHELRIPHEKLNIHGGACVLGHPIGSSGARIIVTLIHALKQHGLKRGVASLCIGGGEATAVAIELGNE